MDQANPKRPCRRMLVRSSARAPCHPQRAHTKPNKHERDNNFRARYPSVRHLGAQRVQRDACRAKYCAVAHRPPYRVTRGGFRIRAPRDQGRNRDYMIGLKRVTKPAEESQRGT